MNKVKLILVTMFLFLAFDASPKHHTYEVKSGDSLWGIAEKYYGKGELYTKIWTISKTTGITANPNQIYP